MKKTFHNDRRKLKRKESKLKGDGKMRHSRSRGWEWEARVERK